MVVAKCNGSAKAALAFNAQAFLDSAGLSKKIVEYARGETIFTQGDRCEDVLYIQTGGVKLSVLSKTGREAVVAMIGPGDFFGEGCNRAHAAVGKIDLPNGFTLLVQHQPRANRNDLQIGQQAAKVFVRQRSEQAVLGSSLDRRADGGRTDVAPFLGTVEAP
jgi:hypothetical protein